MVSEVYKKCNKQIQGYSLQMGAVLYHRSMSSDPDLAVLSPHTQSMDMSDLFVGVVTNPSARAEWPRRFVVFGEWSFKTLRVGLEPTASGGRPMPRGYYFVSIGMQHQAEWKRTGRLPYIER